MGTRRVEDFIQMLLREATSASGKEVRTVIKSKSVGTKVFVGVLFSEYLYEKENRTEGEYVYSQ